MLWCNQIQGLVARYVWLVYTINNDGKASDNKHRVANPAPRKWPCYLINSRQLLDYNLLAWGNGSRGADIDLMLRRLTSCWNGVWVSLPDTGYCYWCGVRRVTIFISNTVLWGTLFPRGYNLFEIVKGASCLGTVFIQLETSIRHDNDPNLHRINNIRHPQNTPTSPKLQYKITSTSAPFLQNWRSFRFVLNWACTATANSCLQYRTATANSCLQYRQ